METVYNLPYFLDESISYVDWEVFLNMDADTLNRACQINRLAAEVCATDVFWKQKIERDYSKRISRYPLAGVTYRQYYNMLNSKGLDLLALCAQRPDIEVCGDDDFWRIKVRQDFGSNISSLSKDDHLNQYAELSSLESDYDRGYITTTYLRDQLTTVNYNTGKYLDHVLFMVQKNTLKEYLVRYLTTITDKLSEAGTYKEYTTILEDVNGRIQYLDLVGFLYEYGVLTVKKHPVILNGYILAVASYGNDKYDQKLVDLGIFDEVDHTQVSEVAARRGNINFLYELHNSGYELDITSIRRILPLGSSRNIRYADTANFANRVLGLPLTEDVFENAMLYTSLNNLKDVYDLGADPGPDTFALALNNEVGEAVYNYLLSIKTSTESINSNKVNISKLSPDTIAWISLNGFMTRFR